MLFSFFILSNWLKGWIKHFHKGNFLRCLKTTEMPLITDICRLRLMVCLYLQAIERYTGDFVPTYTDTVFIFIVNLYKYQNVFKIIPANTVSLLGKQFWCIIIDRVALVYDECRDSEAVRYETWCYSVRLVYCWHVFLFWISL